MKKLNAFEASEKDIWLYSSGNFANNIIFTMVSLYVMYFYTNMLGVSPVVAGTIFMVARLVDAFTDPIMGMIVDRTNTKKFGKYRPYIIFGAPFLGIAFVMLFFVPDLSIAGKTVYAYVSYIVYSLTWTCVQIPQLTLPIILSNNIARRTKIQAVFQALGAVGAMVVQSWALPFLNALGGQEDKDAWFKLILIFAIVSTIIFILSAMSVRKLDLYNPNMEVKKGGNKLSIKDSLLAIVKNRALICVLLAFGTDMFATQISNSLRIYFFQYNMNGRTDLITYLGYVGTIAAFFMLFGIAPYVKKMGKRVGITAIELISIGFSLLLFFAAPKGNVTLVMISFIGTTFLFNITNTLSRAAVLDAANLFEVETGMDCNSLISSTFTFVNKCCQALSAYFAGSILTSTGYNPAIAQQSSATLNAILYLITLVPIAAYVFSLIGMYFYPLTRKGELELEMKVLELRKKKSAIKENPQLEV